MTEIQRVGDLPSAPGLEPLEAAATAQLASGLPKPPVAFPTLGDAEPWKNVSAEPETLRGVLNALGENLSREETSLRPEAKPNGTFSDDLPEQDAALKPAAPTVAPAGPVTGPVSSGSVNTPAAVESAPVFGVNPLQTAPSAPLAPAVQPEAPKSEVAKGDTPVVPAATPAPTQPEAPRGGVSAPAVTPAPAQPAEVKPQVAPQVIPQVAPQTPAVQPEAPKSEQPVAPAVTPAPAQPAEVKPQVAPQVISQVAPQTPAVQPEAPKGEQPVAPAVTPAPAQSAEVKPQVIPQVAPQMPAVQPEAPKGEQPVAPAVTPAPTQPAEAKPQVVPQVAPQASVVQPETPKGGVTAPAEVPAQKDVSVAEKPQAPIAAPVTDKTPLAKPEMPEVLPTVAGKEVKPVEKDAGIAPAPVQVMAQPVVVEAPVTVAQTAPVVAPQVTQMVAAAEAVTAAISVSHALATTGEGEIHVQLKEDVLDGSSIRLTVKGGDLKVLITPATRAAEETFVKHQEAFQTHLAERVTNWRISVGVSLWGSRAFGNYRSEDEV